MPSDFIVYTAKTCGINYYLYYIILDVSMNKNIKLCELHKIMFSEIKLENINFIF